MARNKLTAAEVANAGDGVHGDGAGLNLRVKGSSRKWIYRFTRDGKVTELGLGSAHAVPLKLARKLRDQHEQALAQGLRPALRTLEAQSGRQDLRGGGGGTDRNPAAEMASQRHHRA